MHDPEFEKQVREKMSELKFSPSESVWASVQRQIAKDRRRKPLFWIFPLAALIVAGGAAILLYHSSHTNSVRKNISTTKAVFPPSDKNNSTGNSPREKGQDDPTKNLIPQSPGLSSTQKRSASTAGTGKYKTSAKDDISMEKKLLAVKKEKDDRQGEPQASPSLSSSEASGTSKPKPPSAFSPSIEEQPAAGVSDNGKKPDSLHRSAQKNESGNPTAKQDQKEEDDDFLIGFTASGGMSDVFQSQVTTHTVNAAYPVYLSTYNLAAAALPGIVHPPSALTPGFAFSAGFVGEKKIGKRFYASFGLNYRYYSASLQTGAKIDSAMPGYAWGNGYTYTNKYHFLELPVSLGYHLNKGKKLPMFAELGVSVAEMVGGKSLQYDYLSGVYLESASHFSKTQLLGNASYLFELKQKNLIIKLGPQVQYGFTNLADQSSLTKDHLFFAGVKFIILPKK